MASVSEVPSASKASGTFREAALSSLIGVGVIFLIFFARPDRFGWRLALYGALSGFSIFLSCRALFALVGERIQRLGIPRPLVAAVVFFFGGAVGWGLASVAAQVVGLTRIDFSARDIGVALGIAGSMGLPLRLVFFFFGSCRNACAKRRAPEGGGVRRGRSWSSRGRSSGGSFRRMRSRETASASRRGTCRRASSRETSTTSSTSPTERSGSSSRTSRARGSAPPSSWRPSRPSFPSSPPAARLRRRSSS